MQVKPASGSGQAPQPVPTASGEGAVQAKPMTEAERINANTAASQRDRRRREIETIELGRARSAVYATRDACKKELADLKERQYAYVQNLYGKTHASQIASEMAAKSVQCDTKDRELVHNFNSLLAECKSLQGCAGAGL